MPNCVERLRKCGMPDRTILVITAFVDPEVIEMYAEITEREHDNANVETMQSQSEAGAC